MLEAEVDNVVGLKGTWNRDRTAMRHGHDDGETLGGRRVEVRRERVRTADGESELRLATYEHFADRDAPCRIVLERKLAGVSTRRSRRTQEPVGEDVETEARPVLALIAVACVVPSAAVLLTRNGANAAVYAVPATMSLQTLPADCKGLPQYAGAAADLGLHHLGSRDETRRVQG